MRKSTNYTKIQPISPELALVVGAITESQELIDHALENEKKGAINMCTALEELKKRGRAGRSAKRFTRRFTKRRS